jgi:hypothetical protein
MKRITGKLLFRVLLFVFGLAIASTGTRVIVNETGVGYYVHETPSVFHPFWVPISYSVIQTPDYSFKLLSIGVFLATTGFWTTIDELIKMKTG